MLFSIAQSTCVLCASKFSFCIRTRTHTHTSVYYLPTIAVLAACSCWCYNTPCVCVCVKYRVSNNSPCWPLSEFPIHRLRVTWNLCCIATNVCFPLPYICRLVLYVFIYCLCLHSSCMYFQHRTPFRVIGAERRCGRVWNRRDRNYKECHTMKTRLNLHDVDNLINI